MVIGSAVVAFCLVCLLAAVLRESDGAGDADIARMKRNLLAYWIGAEADRDDPMVIASLRGVEQAAGAALEAMGSDGGRGDIDYEAQSGREFRVARHVSRVAAMAEGFRTPGQSRCGDPGLVGAVEQSLSVAHDLVGDDWPT